MSLPGLEPSPQSPVLGSACMECAQALFRKLDTLGNKGNSHFCLTQGLVSSGLCLAHLVRTGGLLGARLCALSSQEDDVASAHGERVF